MKTFKQLLSETDLRFGTPEDPRLNIHDPLYDKPSAYDPEHAATMRAVAAGDTDYIPPAMRTGGRHGGANTVVMDPNAEKMERQDTFHSFKPMTQAEVAKHMGFNSREHVQYIEKGALKKLLIGLQNDPKLKKLFARLTGDHMKGGENEEV